MRALRVLQHQQQPALRCSPSRVVLDCLFARRVSSSIAAAAASRLPPPPPRPTTITSHPLRDHRRRPTIHLQTRTIFGFGGGGGGGKDKGPPQWEFPPGDPRRVPSTPAEHLARARPLLTPAGARSWARSHALGLQGVALLAAGAGALFYFAHRQTVPVSGRRRFNCYGEEAVRRVARAEVARVEYEVERAGSRFLPDWDPRAVLVRRVLRRLIPVSGAQDQEWEVRVIEAPGTANAMVLPGGKVFVYSGLLPIAATEDGVAAVLGHEIAHNLAQHAAERMSGQIGINILLWSVVFLTGGILVPATSFLGAHLLDLMFARPMGRLQEQEADYIGLMMMAEACYDPRAAVGFWRRMEAATRQHTPEWASTHPSHHNRIQKISEWMPKAMEKREQSDCQGTAAFADLFRSALRRGVIIERDTI